MERLVQDFLRIMFMCLLNFKIGPCFAKQYGCIKTIHTVAKTKKEQKNH